MWVFPGKDGTGGWILEWIHSTRPWQSGQARPSTVVREVPVCVETKWVPQRSQLGAPTGTGRLGKAESREMQPSSSPLPSRVGPHGPNGVRSSALLQRGLLLPTALRSCAAPCRPVSRVVVGAGADLNALPCLLLLLLSLPAGHRASSSSSVGAG